MGPRLLSTAALALLLAPLASASFHEAGLPDAGAQDLHARRLHVLAYHPFPDARDSWGFPGLELNRSDVGYMEAAYGAYWYPTGVLDGERVLEGATEFRTTYVGLEEALARRAEIDAPVRLAMMGSLRGDNATLDVAVRAKQELPIQDATLRIVLYEDEIRFKGDNGVQDHRFTVRAVQTFRVPLRSDADYRVSVDFAVNASWDRSHLGVVASVHNTALAALGLRPGEVLQATTYEFSQDGPTIQHSRGVLLEVLTATWCDACIYGDAAVDELANTYGIASSRALSQSHVYARAFPPFAVAVGALVASLAGVAIYLRQKNAKGA